MKRRIYAWILTLAMVLSLIPATAFAADGGADVAQIGTDTYATLAEAVAAAEEGATVTLLCDAEGAGLKINKDITIDLGGYTYTIISTVGSNGTETNGLQLLKDNNIVIKNGTIAAGADDAVNTAEGDPEKLLKVLIMNYANLTLTDVTLDCQNGNNIQYVLSNNCGDTVLEGDTNILLAEDSTAVAFDAYDYNNTYYSTPSVTITTTGTIEGSIEVTGNSEVAIFGGTYTTELDEAWCTEGFIPTENADGTYGVKEGSYVAAIGDEKYETLEAAIEAAGDGATITLLTDISYLDTESLVRVPADKNITIDLGGKTITSDAGWYAINNQGTLTLTNGTIVATPDYDYYESWGIINNAGKLTLDGVTVKGTEDSEWVYPIYNRDGYWDENDEWVDIGRPAQVTLQGDTVLMGEFYWTNEVENEESFFVITGGSYEEYVSGSDYINGGVLVDPLCDTNYVDGLYVVEKAEPVAEVNGVQYANFSVAVKAAIDSGFTLKLLSDITVTSTKFSLTNQTAGLDLNGYTLTVNKNTTSAFISMNGESYFYLYDTSEEQTGLLQLNNAGDPNGGATFASHMIWISADSEFKVESGRVALGGLDLVYDYPIFEVYGVLNIYAGAIEILDDLDADTLAVNDDGIVIISDKATLSNYGNLVAKNGDTYYTSLEEAVAAAEEGDTVTLLCDAEGAGLKIDKDITIDLGGYTYTIISTVGSTGTETSGLQLLKDNNIVIKNGTIKAGADDAVNTAEGDPEKDLKVLIQNYSNLTLTDVVLDATECTTMMYVVSNNCGNTTLDGTTSIDLAEGSDAVAFDVYDYSSAGYAVPSVSVSTTGTIEGKIEVSETATLAISNGTYTVAVDETWCADGFIPTENADGTYGVKEGSYVAEVNGVKYETLVEAVAAAEEGDTVTLLCDAEGAGLKINKDITIDLGGYTYTIISTVGSTGTETNGLQLLKDNNIVIKNGTIAAGADDAVNTAEGDPEKLLKVLIMNYANLTLTDVTLDCQNGNNIQYVLSNNCGDTVLEGDTNILLAEDSTAVAFDAYDYNNTYYSAPSVTITTTGTIEGSIEVTGNSEVAISGGTYTTELDEAWCAEGFIPTENVDGTYGVKEGSYVAEVNGVKYETLAEAVAAAENGATVTLLCDAEGAGLKINKDITIDLGGYTYTIISTVGSTGTETNGLQLLKDNNIVIKNGTIAAGADDQVNTADGDPKKLLKVLIMNYANLTLTDVTLDCQNGNNIQYVMSNNCGDTVLEGNTNILIAENSDAVAFDAYDYNNTYYSAPSVTITTTGTIEGKIEVTGNSEVAISGGTYDVAIDEAWCADGFIPTKNADGTYGVKEGSYVAEVNGVKYETLAEAVAAAEEGATVTLLCDAEGAGLKINKDITIDLGGYTYTIISTVGSTGTETNGLQLLKDNNIVIKNGTIAAGADDQVNTADGDPKKLLKVLIMNYANLTLTDVTLDCQNGNNIQYVMSNNCGDTVLEGNTNILIAENSTAVAFDAYDYNNTYYSAPSVTITTTGTIEGKIEVTGNSEVAISGGTYTVELDEAWCADGYIPKDNGDGTYGVEIDELDKIVYIGHTLNLDGVLYINQYVTVEGYEGIDITKNGGLMIWTSEVTEGEAIYANAEIINAGMVASSNGRYRQATQGLAAAQYADTLYLRVYIQLEDGTYAYGPLKAYSVRDYCETAIAKYEGQENALRDTCVALLHYGAAAQTYFEYNTEDLANKNIVADYPVEEWDASLLTPLDTFTTDIVATGDVVHIGKALNLDSAIQINYYYEADGFDVKSGELLVWDGVTDTLTEANASYTVELTASGTRYSAASKMFAAAEYGKTIFVCAKFVDTEGNVHYSDVIASSPEAYAENGINKSSNAALVEVMKRMVTYGEYAKIYFESLSE